MFELTLLDHLRLTFGQVVHRHRVHTRTAFARARWSRWLRGAEAALMTGVVGAALGAASGRAEVRAYALTSAVLAGLAVVTLILRLTFDLDGAARAHAACAARLWRIREQYRGLLSDLTDGALELDAVRQRRDALVNELHAVYENAPPADYQEYQGAARKAITADEDTITDEEIDRFLPKSLQKGERPAAA
jgi:conflict system pore-forming effector with SLATT domain